MFSTKNCFGVPYSAEQMFVLVNDIASYSEFIPGCIYSHVLMENDYELTAEMQISQFGVSESFMTHNFMVRNKSIIIQLIHGPFKSFFGCWKFIHMSRSVSQIEYIFYYEFHSMFIEKVFNYVCQDIINNITKSFICRADILYHM